MASRPHDSHPATEFPVPMLDVNRQNAPLKEEIAAAIAAVVDSGAFVQGPPCRELEAAMAEFCGTRHAIGCASGSDALLLSLMALDVGRGDEVVLPSFTFFATAGAVWRLGATPVFADILPDTFNIDPADVARKLTPATKAIIPVHLFGQSVDMTELAAVAGQLPIVEDAAQAIGAEYQGQTVGSLGATGCFSYYPTKNLGGFGDGGMITTNDEQLANKLRILRDHGQQPRYYHSLVGVNSRLDTLQAAVLNVKLRHLAEWAEGRQRNASRYRDEFERLDLDKVLGLPQMAPGCNSVWNQYTIRVPDGRRDELQQCLTERKIGSAIYYPVPLHLQECFSKLGYSEGDLPATEKAAAEVLSLPIYAELTSSGQDRTIQAIAEFLGVEYVAEDAQRAA